MKKALSLCLVFVLLFALAAPAAAATPETAQPYYVNTAQARISMSISSSGLVAMDLLCTGLSGVTSIKAVLYLERQVGSQWVRVNNGIWGNTWTITSSGRFFVQTVTHFAEEKGNYRAVVTYYVYGATETEVLTFNTTREYI